VLLPPINTLLFSIATVDHVLPFFITIPSPVKADEITYFLFVVSFVTEINPTIELSTYIV